MKTLNSTRFVHKIKRIAHGSRCRCGISSLFNSTEEGGMTVCRYLDCSSQVTVLKPVSLCQVWKVGSFISASRSLFGLLSRPTTTLHAPEFFSDPPCSCCRPSIWPSSFKACSVNSLAEPLQKVMCLVPIAVKRRDRTCT